MEKAKEIIVCFVLPGRPLVVEHNTRGIEEVVLFDFLFFVFCFYFHLVKTGFEF